MKEKKRCDYAFPSRNEEENTNKTFEYTKEEEEGPKGHEGDSLFEQCLNEGAGRTKSGSENFEKTKPKENNENGNAGEGDTESPEGGNEMKVE